MELIHAGDDVNAANEFGETPLLQTVRYASKNEEEAARLAGQLLDRGANVNAQTVDGETALMRTAYYNSPTLARLLIARGADVNLRRTDGDTVLSSLEAAPSVVKRRKRILKILEDAGAIR